MWFCDCIWILNIITDFITIRSNIVSRDSIDIAIDYMKTEFAIDLIATFPTIITNHKKSLMFLRLIHITNITKADSLLKIVLEVILPYNRIARGQIQVSARIAFIIVFWIHLYVVLWLYAGTHKLMGDPGLPWSEADPIFKTYNHEENYVLTIYWIFTLVTTVGYGDFVGATRGEYLITVFFMFCGVLIFSMISFLVVRVLSDDYDFYVCVSEKFN